MFCTKIFQQYGPTSFRKCFQDKSGFWIYGAKRKVFFMSYFLFKKYFRFITIFGNVQLLCEKYFAELFFGNVFSFFENILGGASRHPKHFRNLLKTQKLFRCPCLQIKHYIHPWAEQLILSQPDYLYSITSPSGFSDLGTALASNKLRKKIPSCLLIRCLRVHVFFKPTRLFETLIRYLLTYLLTRCILVSSIKNFTFLSFINRSFSSNIQEAIVNTCFVEIKFPKHFPRIETDLDVNNNL